MKKIKVAILSTLAVTALSAGLTFLPANVAKAEVTVVKMNDGAEVRTGDKDGIRFKGTVDKTIYDNAKASNENVRAGIILLTQDKVEGELTHDDTDVLDIKADMWYRPKAEDTEYTFTGVLMGKYDAETGETKFPAEFYGKAIVARAYYYDGTNYTYSDVTVTRSIANTASRGVADDSDLQGYIDGVLANANVTFSGIDGHINAGDSATLAPSNIQTYVQDGLEITGWKVNEGEGVTVENGTIATTQGVNDAKVSVLYGTKEISTTFDIYAAYTTGYAYENYAGEFIEDDTLENTTKAYAKVGTEVTVSDAADEKYLRGGDFTYDATASVTVVGAKDTKAIANYTQIPLTEEGLLMDANKGAWQVLASYNDNVTNEVTISKNTEVKDSGKNSSIEIDWNGGYYTYLHFDTKNAIADYSAYNAISFRMKNDAQGARMLYLYSLQNGGKGLSQAAPTGVVGREWSYYVLPLDKTATAQDQISLLVKFSTGYADSHNNATTGKTYFSDIKLINYETPENTLIDFGYSNTALNVSGNWSESLDSGGGRSSYYGSGVQDPVTGGSTFKIQDSGLVAGATSAPWTYRTGYGFFLGAAGNNSNDFDKYYQALSTVFANKGEAVGVRIKTRIYCESNTRGFDGYWIKPFDSSKEWVWCSAPASTGKVAGSWTDVEFTMTELPTANNCRFYITVLGGWGGGSQPSADGNAAISALYISNFTYEYVTQAMLDEKAETFGKVLYTSDNAKYTYACDFHTVNAPLNNSYYALQVKAYETKNPWFRVSESFDWTNVKSISFDVYNPTNYAITIKPERVLGTTEYALKSENTVIAVSDEWQTFTYENVGASAEGVIAFYISKSMGNNNVAGAWEAFQSQGLYFDNFVITYNE